MSTIFSRKDVDSVARALVQQYNALHQATIATTVDGYHRDISGVPSGDFSAPSSADLQVSADDATDLASSQALALNLKGVLSVHFADDQAHLIADTVNVTFEGDGYVADTLAHAEVLANQMKADFNAHLTQSGVHLNNDMGNTVVSADATDQGSLDTLLNETKVNVNAHILSGPTVGRVKLISS